ncbi:DUF4160 domain-containing protein [Francisella sp. 19X1-34]|uniref:DUF4160 domain-containing protein n=1 Tax=Francisella sp. 19X1-34 TaxID=3087177 RepID=UPI002E36B2CA|nr:DUF4160 domain-containing protein [Francisella sp. 19X1-34]MED7789465.1 DUF4160 domain-containing protein [Francisella sp. 19X1-34]
MPQISTFYGIIIYMYWREHNPPHFHAEYQGSKVAIDINTLTVIEGSLPRRGINLVLDWAEIHKDELLKNWDLCQMKQHPNKIDPLA